MAIEYLGLSEINGPLVVHLERMDDYKKAVDDFYNTVMEKNA